LFSVRLWELPAWFDATGAAAFERVRLWLSLPNFSASYHIFRLPNVMPLIFSFPDFCLIIFSGQAA